MPVALLCMTTLLVVLAWRAGRQASHSSDYFLGNRNLSDGVIALSQASRALPPWLALGVAGAAFVWGFAAIWTLVAALAAHVLNWNFVAPRVRAWSAGLGGVTLLQMLAADGGTRIRGAVNLTAILLVFLAILLGMAAYLPLVGQAVALHVHVSATLGMLLALAAATLCALVGGFAGACKSDSVRAISMLLLGLVIASAGVIAAGGFEPVWANLANPQAGTGFWTGTGAPVLAVTFVLGTVSMSLATVGQPDVVNRYMACADQRQIASARRLAFVWTLLMLGSMLLAGWSARILLPDAVPGANVLLLLIDQILPRYLAPVAVAALIAIAATAMDSLLLVMAAAVSVDVKSGFGRGSLDWPKPAVVLAGALLAAVALQAAEPAFDRLLLAWTLLGSAFGPLLLVRLTGKRVRPGSTLGSIWAGCVLTLLLHLLPDAPGDFLERALPFVAALGIALSGGEQRRDPDRADRARQISTASES